MAGVTIDVSELNRLAVDLVDAGPRVGARVATVVRVTALAIERDGKAFAPVDTGFLRSSIGHEFSGDGRSAEMEAIIGPTASYGIYLEVGTSRMAPHSFMGPALDRNTPAFVEGIGQAADGIW